MSEWAYSVPCCLDFDIGAITPQFHVTFDKDFVMVATKHEYLPEFALVQWSELFGTSIYKYVLDADDQAAKGSMNSACVLDLLNASRNCCQCYQSPAPIQVSSTALIQETSKPYRYVVYNGRIVTFSIVTFSTAKYKFKCPKFLLQWLDPWPWCLLIFFLDGTIPIAAINFPGSFPDSQITNWREVYQDLESVFEDNGGRCMADLALATYSDFWLS